VATWWSEERSANGMTGGTSSWEEFKQFLCARFSERSMESNKVVVQVVQARVAEDDTPLRGMSIQLHKLATGDKAVVRNQRWSLFQTQCTIKEKTCKLIIDSGSHCNGISKVVVSVLGLSTWHIPEPRHVEWVNSCGMLKITQRCVSHLQLMTMLMRWNAMCCHWRCMGCYLDVHGSMIVMLYMLGEQRHIPLCMMENTGL
jgi:hypothetical protein